MYNKTKNMENIEKYYAAAEFLLKGLAELKKEHEEAKQAKDERKILKARRLLPPFPTSTCSKSSNVIDLTLDSTGAASPYSAAGSSNDTKYSSRTEIKAVVKTTKTTTDYEAMNISSSSDEESPMEETTSEMLNDLDTLLKLQQYTWPENKKGQ